MRRFYMPKGVEEELILNLYQDVNLFDSLSEAAFMEKTKGTRYEKDSDLLLGAFNAIKNSSHMEPGTKGSYFGTVLHFLDMLGVDGVNRHQYMDNIIFLFSGDQQNISMGMQRIKRVQLLDELELVTEKSCHTIFSGNEVDRECYVRKESIKMTIQLADFKDKDLENTDLKEKQTRWGDASFAIESRVCEMILEKQPLVSIFEFARLSRKKIAIFEKYYNKSQQFGEFFSNGIIDHYNTNPHSFESLVSPEIAHKIYRLLIQNLPKETDRILRDESFPNNQGNKVRQIELRTVVKKTKPVIEQDITIVENAANPDYISIISKFHNFRIQAFLPSGFVKSTPEQAQALSDKNVKKIQGALRRIDRVYLTPIREKTAAFKDHASEDQDKDFLLDLGLFAYQLVRLYPLQRGSAAVNQQILRGVCQSYFHPRPINIPDILLGEGIPFDIYAQFTFKKNQYAEVFREALLPIFKQARDVVKESALGEHSIFAVSRKAPVAASSSPESPSPSSETNSGGR